MLREGWTTKDPATNERSVDSVKLAAEAGDWCSVLWWIYYGVVRESNRRRVVRMIKRRQARYCKPSRQRQVAGPHDDIPGLSICICAFTSCTQHTHPYMYDGCILHGSRDDGRAHDCICIYTLTRQDSKHDPLGERWKRAVANRGRKLLHPLLSQTP